MKSISSDADTDRIPSNTSLQRRGFLLAGGTALLAACGASVSGVPPSGSAGGRSNKSTRRAMSAVTSMTCGTRWRSTVSVNADRSVTITPLGNAVIPSARFALNGSLLSFGIGAGVNSFTIPADPSTIPTVFQTTTSDGTMTKFNGASAAATAFDSSGITSSLAFLTDGSMGVGVMSNGSSMQNGQWESNLSTAMITTILQQASQITAGFGIPTPAPAAANLINNVNKIQAALDASGDIVPTPKPCGQRCPPPPLMPARRIHPMGMGGTCYDLIKTTINDQTGAIVAQIDLGTIFCALDNFPSFGFAGNANHWGGGGRVRPTPTPSPNDKFRCLATALLASYGVTALKGFAGTILRFAKGNPRFWTIELEGGAAVTALLADILLPVLAAVMIGLTLWALEDAIASCRASGVI